MMDFLSRAWKQNIRKPMKTFMIFLVMFVISNLMVTGLFILKGTKQATDATLSKITPTVYYAQDYDKYYRAQELGFVDYENDPMPPISLDVAKEIGSLPVVKEMDLGTSYTAGIKNLKPYQDANLGGIIGGTPISYDDNEFDPLEEMLYSFEIIGTSSSTFKTINHMISIDQGRGIEASDVENENKVIMVESRLAKENDLSIGGTLHLQFRQINATTNYQPDNTVEVEFEIVGIYKNLTTDNSSNPLDNQRAANQIYAPYNLTVEYGREANLINLEQAISEGTMTQDEADTWLNEVEESAISTVGYTLNDPLKVHEFTMDAQKYLPSEYHLLKVADSTYNSIAKSISSMTDTSNLIIYVVFGTGVLILGLITSLTLKSREYEIGVLLSIGESKLKVIGQLLSELLIIAFVAFSLSIFSGSFIAKNYGQALLQTQMDSAMSTSDHNSIFIPDLMNLNNESTLSYTDFVNNFNISLEPIVYIQLIGYGMLVVGISAVVPIAFIMRYNPKTILTIR